MEEIILEAQARKDTGSRVAKHLRHEGFIPAVVYSAGKKSQAIQVERSKMLHFLHTYRAEGVVINLNVKDETKHKNYNVMIKEIQHDPVKEDIMHVDFNEISLTKAIKAAVPIVTKGEAPGVKQDGGSLDHILWEVEVECLPTAIPKEIVVDISSLKIGDAIAIKDIKFPEGVKVLHDPNASVLSVAAPIKVEEVVAAAEAGAGPQEPEVIKEKKEVPEAEAEGGAGKEKAKEKEEKK
ncbi:MAG: 50S ribosomal protein L25 [Candidatus Omnitrophica bacterium]|nr:50S ribosomal protein L25 [Candidatus Omnitrophota bacterium]MDD5610094.1 50S ribosomal protein L25 [Candidatus Omnitrophota bacterium]